jgi:tetratricopeptide (TPR) repeat protein
LGWLLFLTGFLVGRSLFALAPSDSLSIAAEYYFSRQDYNQSLALWSEVLKRRPDNLSAVYRVAELKLMFQGRVASRDVILGFLAGAGRNLNSDARRDIKLKLGELQSTFVTDDGQSVFLRALPKIRHGDCQGAMALLVQAAGAEGGNLRVLQEKARCEKTLGLYERFYESLRAAFDSDPFDESVRENLFEAYVYNGEMAKVIAMAKEGDSTLSLRERIAYAVALTESGAEAAALPILQNTIEQEKLTGVPPIVLYALGKAFAAKPDGLAEATSYLERFLGAAARPENTLINGWDPYRSAEKLEQAKKMLSSLKTKDNPSAG